jgi:hypothetical protein
MKVYHTPVLKSNGSSQKPPYDQGGFFGIVSSWETWLYNLLLPDHSPVVSKTFQSAGLLSNASKSVKRSRYALKRCRFFASEGFYRQRGEKTVEELKS